MSFPGYGSPLFGGPPPQQLPRSVASITRNVLWRQVPSIVTLEQLTNRKTLSLSSQLISVATVFAAVENNAAVTIGNENVRVSGSYYFDNASFELDPGRSAEIYTDDFQHEFYDLNKIWAVYNSTLNTQTQVLFVTIWQPTFL